MKEYKGKIYIEHKTTGEIHEPDTKRTPQENETIKHKQRKMK